MTKTSASTASTGPIAVTMGEPSGIGGEIVVKAWQERQQHQIEPFFVLDEPGHLRRAAAACGLETPIVEIERPEAAQDIFDDALPVLPLTLQEPETAGMPATANAGAVLGAVKLAVEFCLNGRTRAMVTNPIQKSSLLQSGFKHAGHTEYLAELCGGKKRAVMMLCCPGLRTVPVTIHRPLVDAIAELSTSLIVETALVTAAALRRDFGLGEPKLWLTGLNPHAGESGGLGREDIDTIAPAVEILKQEGLRVRGPLAADSMFHDGARAKYDAAICMYHDQALIPIKTIGFDAGVNVTLGLPLIRTSPDHGTALALAGSGKASAGSMIAALKLAAEMSRARSHAGRSA